MEFQREFHETCEAYVHQYLENDAWLAEGASHLEHARAQDQLMKGLDKVFVELNKIFKEQQNPRLIDKEILEDVEQVYGDLDLLAGDKLKKDRLKRVSDYIADKFGRTTRRRAIRKVEQIKKCLAQQYLRWKKREERERDGKASWVLPEAPKKANAITRMAHEHFLGLATRDSPPLIRAVEEGDAYGVRHLLLIRSIDPNQVGRGGRTPLMVSAEKGNVMVTNALLEHPKCVEGIDMKDEEGNTALHWACLKNHVQVVLALLQNHANISIRNKLKETPLDIIVKNGDSRMDLIRQFLATQKAA